MDWTGIGFARSTPAIQIGQGDIVHFHTETLEVLVEQADGGTEHTARYQNMVTGTAQAHHGSQNRRHAGGCRHRLLRILQRSNTLLEGAHGRVHVTRIDVAGALAGKTRSGVTGTAKHIAGGQKQRFAMFSLRAAMLAGTHCQSIETNLFKIAVQTPWLPIGNHLRLH